MKPIWVAILVGLILPVSSRTEATERKPYLLDIRRVNAAKADSLPANCEAVSAVAKAKSAFGAIPAGCLSALAVGAVMGEKVGETTLSPQLAFVAAVGGVVIYMRISDLMDPRKSRQELLPWIAGIRKTETGFWLNAAAMTSIAMETFHARANGFLHSDSETNGKSHLGGMAGQTVTDSVRTGAPGATNPELEWTDARKSVRKANIGRIVRGFGLPADEDAERLSDLESARSKGELDALYEKVRAEEAARKALGELTSDPNEVHTIIKQLIDRSPDGTIGKEVIDRIRRMAVSGNRLSEIADRLGVEVEAGTEGMDESDLLGEASESDLVTGRSWKNVKSNWFRPARPQR